MFVNVVMSPQAISTCRGYSVEAFGQSGVRAEEQVFRAGRFLSVQGCRHRPDPTAAAERHCCQVSGTGRPVSAMQILLQACSEFREYPAGLTLEVSGDKMASTG